MTEERRIFTRYNCLLPAEILMAERKDKLIKRTSVHDFSRGGLKLVVKFVNLDPGSKIDLRLYVPEKELNATLKAEIAWKKFDDDKMEVGLKIMNMEEEAQKEILSWIAPLTLETNNK
jgi:c-di-GMP-binding flagellar brake protein YcgR